MFSGKLVLLSIRALVFNLAYHDEGKYHAQKLKNTTINHIRNKQPKRCLVDFLREEGTQQSSHGETQPRGLIPPYLLFYFIFLFLSCIILDGNDNPFPVTSNGFSILLSAIVRILRYWFI